MWIDESKLIDSAPAMASVVGRPSPSKELRGLLSDGKIIVAPCVCNGFTAQIALLVSFNASYMACFDGLNDVQEPRGLL